VVTIGILVILFGSHVLRVLRVHVLGVLAFLVRGLFPGSALLAVDVAALSRVVHIGRVVHIVHAVHAIFIFHHFHPLCTLAKVVCAGDGDLYGKIFEKGSAVIIAVQQIFIPHMKHPSNGFQLNIRDKPLSAFNSLYGVFINIQSGHLQQLGQPALGSFLGQVLTDSLDTFPA